MNTHHTVAGTLAAAAALVFSTPAWMAGQSATSQKSASRPASSRTYAPPRTPWGDPNLQGTYTNKDESGIPFEKPSELGDKKLDDISDAELKELIEERAQATVARAPGVGGIETGAGPTHWYENYGAKNSRPWLVIDPPDGRIPPVTAEGRERAAAAVAARRGGNGFDVGPFDGPEDLSLYDRCISRGIPGSMMPAIYGNSYQIVQGPGYVAIRYEMVHEARIIPLDGRAHVGRNIESYMGDARGHWDGNTLVVETTNIKQASAYRNASEHLKLTERFTPVAPNAIEWAMTVDDSHTWTRPWTFAMRLTRDESQQVFEYACHEGNYGLRDILSAARAAEKNGTAPQAPSPNRPNRTSGEE